MYFAYLDKGRTIIMLPDRRYALAGQGYEPKLPEPAQCVVRQARGCPSQIRGASPPHAAAIRTAATHHSAAGSTIYARGDNPPARPTCGAR